MTPSRMLSKPTTGLERPGFVRGEKRSCLLGTVRFAPASPILAATRRLGTLSLLFRCGVLEDDAPPDQAIIVAGGVKAVRGRDIEYLRVWVDIAAEGDSA
jgi:hypothetical protein